MNAQSAYQKFILLGVLVGLGKTPQEAINQVQEWQNTGYNFQYIQIRNIE